MKQNYSNYFKGYYEKNKEVLNARKKEKYKQARLDGKPYPNKYKIPSCTSYTYEWKMWYQAGKRAKERNLPYDLELSDIVIPDHCPLLGIPLVRDFSDRNASPSLDRVIPEKGYVKENVRVISMKANRMKQDVSLEFAQALIKYLQE